MGERGRTSSKSSRLKNLKRIDPPDDISIEAVVVWDDIVESLPAAHFIKSDYPLLRTFCESYATVQKCFDKLNEQGWIYTDRSGKKHKSKWADILKDQQQIMGLLATKLRVCVSSRQQMSETTVEIKSPNSKRQHLLE